MKKSYLILLAGTIGVCGCAFDTTPQDTRTEHEINLEEAQQKREKILATTDIMERISKIEEVYNYEMPPYSEKSNTFYRNGDIRDMPRQCTYLEVFMQSGEFKDNLKCFCAPVYEEDNSDECILARRNLKPNELGNFDYASLFPEGHKINSIEAYKDLLGARRYYYDMYYEVCETSQKYTSYEKENCKNNIKQYITDKVMGTLKSCKDVAPIAYKELFTVTDEDIQAAKMSSALLSNFGFNTKKESEFITAMVEDFRKKEAPEFGYKYMCKMENWENDYKNWISKIVKAAKQTKKTGKVITLN
ncbi:MAG: hypothetical protein IKP24_01705 [Alphaproteobacteria bacterium]|nr:hypothetical protein [Alphaproteobacteria bacterium]